MAIHKNDFQYIARLMEEYAGVVLEAEKEYLLEPRLLPLLQQLELPSVNALVAHLQTFPEKSTLRAQVVEAMLNGETYFFRDQSPFDTLRKYILPELMSRRSSERALKIWCAACSTGQEPYSIAILLREHFPMLLNWSLRIIGSDISQTALKQARQGNYTQLEVNRGLPAAYLVKYFTRVGMRWQIHEQIRRMVDFIEINLIKDWPLPMFDIIFMRNVLIYCNLETKKQILLKAQRILKPDGYLFLGGVETTINIDQAFKAVSLDKTVCYRL